MIYENSVYKSSSGERIRIIKIDNLKNELFYISLEKKVCVPEKIKLKTFIEELRNEFFIKVPDPYEVIIDEESLSEKQKQQRDSKWKVVKENIEKEELYDKLTRSDLLRKIASDKNLSLNTIKKTFTRYWQRGMKKNSLLPDYINSGGRGKEKKLKKDSGIGKNKQTIDSNGISVTDEIKTIFSAVLTKYYMKTNKDGLKDVYNLMLRDYFSDKYYEEDKEKYRVWEENRIPSYYQFYYWYKKNRNLKDEITFRESENKYNLNKRLLLSNSKQETVGPGTRFQVDATVADVYLVNSQDRNKIIGRPILYAIMDVYSRLITGIYVGLEGPSWIGAMMALDNMISDKVEYCKKYGIDIKEEEWPAKHLPEIILADRGEFEGFNVENLINNVNIKIENTAPYRGDLKGIVERNFRTINDKIKKKAPGAIMKEYRERGKRDYRLDATLSLEEFTKIYIMMVLQHNNKIIEKYEIDQEAILDGIIPSPINLWKWGVENKKGRLKIIDSEKMRLNILPKSKARISRAGIRFKGLYYSLGKAITEQWFVNMKGRSIEVVYDPRDMNYIYIPNKDGTDFEKCYLLQDKFRFKTYRLEEIEYIIALEKDNLFKQKNNELQNKINFENEIDKIINEAKDLKNKSDLAESKSKRIKGIRKNRLEEKILNRENEKIILKTENEKNKENSNKIKNINENDSNDREKEIFDFLRKRRDELKIKEDSDEK